MNRSTRRALAIFILAGLVTLAFALAGCLAPAAIRKGPDKVPTVAVDHASSRAAALVAQNVALSQKTTMALTKAIEIANKPNLTADDQIKLRLELAGAKTLIDTLSASLLATKSAVQEWQGIAAKYKSDRDEADEKYRVLSVQTVESEKAAIWRERLFGWPIAVGIGIILGLVGALLLGFFKRAAVAALIPHL